MSQNKLDTIIATSKELSNINESLGVLRDKLDTIIELLTLKEIVINSPISLNRQSSSNEHSLQAKDITEALLSIAARYSKKVPTVESDDLLLREIGKEEFIKKLQEVDFPNGVLRRDTLVK
jgi:hypothetical protein